MSDESKSLGVPVIGPPQPEARERGGRAMTSEVAIRTPQSPLRTIAGLRGYVLRRLLAAGDLLALGTAFAATAAIRAALERGPIMPIDPWLFASLLPVWIFLGTLLKLYHRGDRSLDHSIADEIGPVVLVATVWNWALLIARAATTADSVEVQPSVTLWALTILLVLLFRVVATMLARGSAWYRQRVLVIGSTSDTDRVVRRILRHPEYGLEIVGTASPPGLVHDDDAELPPHVGNMHRFHASVGGASELASLAEEVGASRVVVATVPARLEERSELIRGLIDLGVQVDLVSGDPDLCSSNAAALHYVEGLPVLTVPSLQVPRSWKVVKRSIDIGIAGAGLLLLSPMFAAFALAIRLGSPGPVFFRQRRVGFMGAGFELLKFRTMVDGAEEMKREIAGLNMHTASQSERAMFKIPADPRVTRVGGFLRRWSLDELPQLWNVLRGEMSLVGPRPLIPEEAILVKGRYEVRLEMRPGITGPWQTLGRSDIGFEDMIKLDYTYVTNWTLAEDFKLVVRTFGAVFHARGAY